MISWTRMRRLQSADTAGAAQEKSSRSSRCWLALVGMCVAPVVMVHHSSAAGALVPDDQDSPDVSVTDRTRFAASRDRNANADTMK